MLDRIAAVLTVVLCMTTFAAADEWVAAKLRGQVLQLVGNEWVQLRRGDVVPDDRVIRTLANGRVEFRRDAETITLAADTQVQIVDQSGQRFTTVKQQFGVVEVDVEARNVVHFGVVTPYMAAVVKGTRFVVAADRSGASVSVKRGKVAVEDSDTHQSTLLTVGQKATTAAGQPLAVSGKGDLPVIFDANGSPVLAAGLTADDAAAAAYANAIAQGASVKDAEKAAEKAVKAVEKAEKDAAKAEEKAEKDAAKAEEKAAKDAEKAEKGAAKDAEKAEKDAAKEAEKTEKDAAKKDKKESKG